MSVSQRVLHIAHGIPSYNNSLLEMARRLKASQIELCVASHIDLSKVLVDSGVRFTILDADRENIRACADALSGIEGGNNPFNFFKKIELCRSYREHSLGISEIKDLIEHIQPDLLLIDMECHMAILHAIGQNVNIVLCSRWFSVFRTTGTPPMHTVLTPAETGLNTVRINAAWYGLWLKKYWQDLRHRFSRRRYRPVSYAANARYDLQSIAYHVGVNLSQVTDRFHWLMPHVYSNLPVMTLNLEELEFGRFLDHRMNYVGPLVGTRNFENEHYSSSAVEFTRFVNRNTINTRNPLIYISFSTFWRTKQENFDALARLFAERKDLDFVIGLGGSDIPASLGDLPKNVLPLEFAPQLEILKHSAVVISHGGVSTINEALYHGVPLIVCSSGHVDQDGCCARVVYHGVGLLAKKKSFDEHEISCLLDKILCGDESSIQLQRKVRTVRDKMRMHTSSDTMVKFISERMSESH